MINESVLFIARQYKLEWWETKLAKEYAGIPIKEDNQQLTNELGKKAPYILQDLTKAQIPDAENVVRQIYSAAMVTPKMQQKKMSPYLDVVKKWVLNKSVKFPEDLTKTQKTLEEFNKQVVSGTIKGTKSDVNLYDTQQKMYMAVKKDEGLGKSLGFEENGAELLSDMSLNTKFGVFKVYRIEDYEAMEKCGSNTNWCVVHENYFNQYGPPYFLITLHTKEGEERIALAHVRSHQLKNESDQPLIETNLDYYKAITPILDGIFGKKRSEGDVDEVSILRNYTIDVRDFSGKVSRTVDLLWEALQDEENYFHENSENYKTEDDFKDIEDYKKWEKEYEDELHWHLSDTSTSKIIYRIFGTKNKVDEKHVYNYISGFDKEELEKFYDDMKNVKSIGDMSDDLVEKINKVRKRFGEFYDLFDPILSRYKREGYSDKFDEILKEYKEYTNEY